MTARPHVALLIETSNAYGRGLLRGVMAYVREHEPWTLLLREHGRGELAPHEMDAWRGQGILARIENRRIAASVAERQCPIVDLSAARLLPQLPWVETDDDAIAQAAVEHLMQRGLRHYGFCGDDRFNWSHWRAVAFRKLVLDAGFTCSIAPPRGKIDEWIVSLPKPAGVMACYDIRGREVLDACRRANVKVPDEVAVIGVDDDELLCELSDPPLSSVIPDTKRAGWLAAELLDQWMKGAKPKQIGHPVPPAGVRTRHSTDTLAIEDADVASAVRFIREHACDGITVHDVVSCLPLSRRVLESRFQKLLGRTPHAEMLRVRLERAKALLATPGWTLDAIARRTGFGHGEYLSAVFKRECGLTPGDYRRTV